MVIYNSDAGHVHNPQPSLQESRLTTASSLDKQCLYCLTHKVCKMLPSMYKPFIFQDAKNTCIVPVGLLALYDTSMLKNFLVLFT